MQLSFVIKTPGVPKILSNHTKASIINAGDGAHAHPTQALLDLFTLKEHFGDLEGKKIAIGWRYQEFSCCKL